MEPILIVSIVVVLALAIGAFFLLKGVQNSIERLQRAEEMKATNLRAELGTHLQTNRQEMQLGLTQTSKALETRFIAIDARLDSRLKELTEGVQSKLETNLKEGFNHFVKVEEALKHAQTQLQDLNRVGQSIHDLNSLLKLPHLRGGFGEATLERLLSDFLPQGAYELQYKITPDSTERVDAVIRYPKYVLPIDSKFPREQILPLFETDDPVVLEKARKDLVDVMRTLGKSIKSKYIHPEHGTTDMALLFVPSETLYFEILRNSTLCDELARSKVFTVSPNTFAAMLHAVSTARTYYEMAKGVEKTLADLRKASTHLENFQGRFSEVGNALEKAQKTYDVASTHLTRYSNAVARIEGSAEKEAIAVSQTALIADAPGNA